MSRKNQRARKIYGGKRRKSAKPLETTAHQSEISADVLAEPSLPQSLPTVTDEGPGSPASGPSSTADHASDATLLAKSHIQAETLLAGPPKR